MFIMVFLTKELLLLLAALSGCFTEVVDDFTRTCPEFFANPREIRSPPTVFKGEHYKPICQVLDNIYEYATLYDTKSKIPVYSAYRFEGLMNCQRKSSWNGGGGLLLNFRSRVYCVSVQPTLQDIGVINIEHDLYLRFTIGLALTAMGGWDYPLSTLQLEDRTTNRRMQPENSKVNYSHQAVNRNYIYSDYHRGHLAPVYHAESQSCANATFTLTNAAPQNKSFNQGQWRKTEKDVAQTLEDKCKGNFRYIVTGVVPGNLKINDTVNVPSHFWTAYCCLDNNLRVKASRGFLGENINNPVLDISVQELDESLSKFYQQSFHVFGGNCN